MRTIKIAARADEVDPPWLTAVLRANGLIRDARVIGVRHKAIGNGLVGDSRHFTITYDGEEPDAPKSLVGKFASHDPTSKATAKTYGLYFNEVSFYREIARTVGIRTPRTLVAEVDAESHDFTLLFEDLSPARPGDQLTGCSPEDSALAMREAAALHGPRWGDKRLEDLAWLRVGESYLPQIMSMLSAVGGAFRERYAEALEPEYLTVIERFEKMYARVAADRTTPLTVQHGDFRLDNVLFEAQSGRVPFATLDWQTVALGAGVVDVSYFIGAGLLPEARRAHERDLMRLYHDELLKRGVSGYDWETCWRDYRRFPFLGIFRAVFSAMVVERTPRGDEMFLTMARRHCTQALELDSFGFWEA